jgi:hypothetical protein
MNAIVVSLKPSKSGKSDVLFARVDNSVKTAFGVVKAPKFYNVMLEKGSCKLGEGEVFDLDLDAFKAVESIWEDTEGVSHNSLWLEPK